MGKDRRPPALDRAENYLLSVICDRNQDTSDRLMAVSQLLRVHEIRLRMDPPERVGRYQPLEGSDPGEPGE